MAESVTYTLTRVGSVKKLKMVWESGAADGKMDLTDRSVAVDGAVLACAAVPGTATPTDNYDVAIFDEDDVDILGGQGANCDSGATHYMAVDKFGAACGQKLRLYVENAGNSKDGTIYLFLR